MKNYYRILGLELDAENEEIKAAYRILAQRFHPDKGGNPAEFRLIQEAYDILSNPLTKRPYDRDLFNYLNKSAVAVYSTNNSNGSSSTVVLWIVGLLAIGGLGFAGYTYWQQYQQQQKLIKTMIAINAQPAPAPTVAARPTSKPKTTKNKKPVASTPSVVSNPLANLSGTYYLLNIGSYTTLDSAQQKQSSLKSQGYQSSVQRINANSVGETSYNVFMGPYKSRSTAYNIQAQLESRNIDSDIERVDSE